MSRCMAWIGLFAGMTSAAQAQVVLVREGQPCARIVLPQNASDTLKLAAQELQEHVRLISGAMLPIAGEGDAVDGARIYVGTPGPARHRLGPLDEATVGYDGYRFLTNKDCLVLVGRTDAGSLNAVYGFLEEILGVRWYDPGPYGTVLPKTPTIAVPPLSRVSKPRFLVRSPWYNGNCLAGWTDAEKERNAIWRRRNRIGGLRGYVGHQWARAIPPEKFFPLHPEYYSLVQGRRQTTQLCTANPDLVDLYTRDVLARFADPTFVYASLSPNDGAGWCECDACRAVWPDLTGRILTFINHVARRVRAHYPNRLLAFYAYAGIVSPPKGNLRCEPNVMPWVAHYSICQMHPITDPHCPHQARFRRMVDRWKAISRQLGVRDYASWWPVPCVESARLAADTRYYASIGALAMSREYLEVQYGTHLLTWLESKLLWNPNVDVAALLAEFFERFYGPAAPTMRRVYETLARHHETACPYEEQWTGNRHEAPHIFPREMLAHAIAQVQAAEEALPEGDARQRVHRDRLALTAALLFLNAWKADRTYARTGQKADRQAALSALRQVIAFRDALPDNLIVSGSVRQWAREQSALLAADRTLIRRAGRWGFRDSLNEGGMARHDAEEVSGLTPGRWGLVLPARREGILQYHFRTEGDLRFVGAALVALFLNAGDGIRNRIEIQRDDGPWQIFSEDQRYEGYDRRYPLTEYVAGAKAFRLRIWGKNETDQDALLLDNFGIEGEVR